MTDSTIKGGATQTQQAAIGVWNGPPTGYGFTGLRLNVSGGKDGLESAFGMAETVEVLQRGWHIEGQSVRPDHRMVAHTGFLTHARLLGTPPAA